MTKWAEVLDWFKEFQQVLEKKVAEEDAAQAAAVQAAPVTQAATQPTGVMLEERAAAVPQAAVQTVAPIDEAAEQRKREGAALKRLLQGSDISERDFAHQVGTSQTTVSKWINGYRTIDYAAIERSYVSLKLRNAIKRIRLDGTQPLPIAIKMDKQAVCKKCGASFIRYSFHARYCSKCASDRRSAYNGFFLTYPQVKEYLQQRYNNINDKLSQWSARGAPAPCVADEIRQRYSSQIAVAFIRTFGVRPTCNCNRLSQCKERFGKCKYSVTLQRQHQAQAAQPGGTL